MVCDRLQVRARVTTGRGRVRQKGFFFLSPKDRFHPRQTLCPYVSETSEKSDRLERTMFVTTVESYEGRKDIFWLGFCWIR